MKTEPQKSAAPGLLTDAPRYLFLALLIFAPWAYGCTELWALHVMEAGMASILGLWLASSFIRPLPPAVHPVSLGCVSVILLQGCWMIFNAHYRYDPISHLFHPITAPVRWLPGTVDGKASMAMMLRVAGLAGMICFVSDLAVRQEWRARIWWTLGLTGTSIALLGLLQRAMDAPMIFWENTKATTLFFGTFIHHGNAGSFINLVLPLVAGRAVISLGDPNAHGGRALWLSSLFLCVAAAYVNVSRTGALIATLLLGLFILSESRRLMSRIWLPAPKVLMAYVGAVLLFLVGLVLFAGWESPAEKWEKLSGQLNTENPRLLALKACWPMVHDAGVWGLGPGTFAIAFPHYTQFLGDSIAGTWRYAHQDYVQTIIEWGWLGSLAPAVIFLGGIQRCMACSIRPGRRIHEEDRLLLLGAGLALIGVALHALVDFPLQTPALQLYVAVYLGLGWGTSRLR